MAEKLSIEIALEGAAEIERQLEGIGTAGTKAFTEIGKAAEQVGGFKELDPKTVTDKLQKFGVTGKEAIDKITKAVSQAGRLERIVGGVQQIESGFKRIGTTVAAAATSFLGFNRAAQQTQAGIVATSTAMNTLRGAAGGLTGVVTGLGTSLAGLGRLGTFARSGLIGAGAAAAGAAAVGMEKAADAARILEGNLQALFRNPQQGTAFFNQIQQAAQSAGAGLESTAKTMTAIVQTIRSALEAKGIRFAPGEGFKQATAEGRAFFDTLQKGMKLSGATASEANKAIGVLFDEIKTKGQLSGETLRKFAAQFPQLANELVKFLGRPGESMDQLAKRVEQGLAQIDIQKFINALRRADPEIQKLFAAFEPTIAQRMDTIAGAWDRLLSSFGKSPAGAALKQAMNDIATGLDEIAAKKPPTTWTGEFLEEFLRRIETTKQEWNTLVALVTQPVKNLGLMLPDKIVVPFEADPEPKWIEIYLQLIEKVKIAFRSIFTPDVAAAGAAEPAFVQAYLAGIARVKAAFAVIFTPTIAAEGAPEPAFVQAYLTAIQTIKNALSTITWDTITSAGVAAWNAITSAIQNTQSAISQFISSLGSITWGAISGAGVAAWNAVISAIERAISVIGTFLGLSGRAGGGAVGAGASGSFQGGGLLGGRGTGTSDSNLVRVSRGEYIVPARAVRQPGVLAFLETLRRSRGSLQDVLDDMGRFAIGGLVPRTIPAFAGSGLAGGASAGGRSVNLTIVNGTSKDTFRMWADEDVAERVVRYATARQVASAGRKSGAFG